MDQEVGGAGESARPGGRATPGTGACLLADLEVIVTFAPDVPEADHDNLTFMVQRMDLTLGRMSRLDTCVPGFDPRSKHREEDKIVYLFTYDEGSCHVTVGDRKTWCRG